MRPGRGHRERDERLHRPSVASGALLLRFLRLLLLGAVSGALAGVASFAFLEALDAVTRTRREHPDLLFLLPVAGFVIGAVVHHLGGAAARGNALLVEQLHEPTAWLPRRMAPLVFVGTVASHLFGASVGREGAALQMSGALTDALSRSLRLPTLERRLLLVAAIAGGFGAVFGVPVAGAVFALEVRPIGRLRLQAAAPALVAAIVGDQVVRVFGHAHAHRPRLAPPLDASFLVRIALAGLAFGVVARLFVELVHRAKAVAGGRIPYPPLRLAVGGAATVALALVVGREHLGLSLPLLDETLAGHDPGGATFALKLAFTVLALGSGFPGGEVTPLFVIGTTLGGALAAVLGIDVATLAAIGFVAVFAGAAKTPIACAVLGAELFGLGSFVPMAVGCVLAVVAAGGPGIYDHPTGGGQGRRRWGRASP